MQWPGMDVSKSPLGEGLALVVNASYVVDGELRRRPGLGDRLTLSAHLLGAVQHVEAGQFLIAVQNAAIYGYDLDTGSLFSCYTLTNSYAGACLANANGRLYYSDGINPMLVISRGDQAAVAAGIAGPTSAPSAGATAGGVVTAGVHLVRYRWKDALTGYVSNPSPPLSYTAAGSANLPLTITASSDSKVTNAIIEMTIAGGTEFFVALEVVDGTSATVNISDLNLAVQVPSNTYAPPDGFGQDQPPIASLLIEHRGRLIAWGAATISGATASVTNGSTAVDLGADAVQGHAYVGRTIRIGVDNETYNIVSGVGNDVVLSIPYAGSTASPVAFVIVDPGADTMWWSRAVYPEGWNLALWNRSILQGMNADVPAGMLSFCNDIYFFGQRSARRMVYEDDPGTALLVTASTNMGVFNQSCIVDADGMAFGWGQGGAWRLRGTNPQHFSRRIDAYVRSDYDTTYSSLFFGFFDPIERVVWWCYVRDGETTPRGAICYDIDKDKWLVRRFRHHVRCALTYGDATRAEHAYIATSDGSTNYTWKLEADRFDGAPSILANGVLTADAGATTTVVPVVESLSDILGVIVYRPATDEERIVSANTANGFTVSVAFATAPSVGEALWIGSIRAEVLSYWDLYDDRLANKQKPRALELENLSDGADLTARVQTFADFSPSAFVYGNLYADDTQSRGVTSYSTNTKSVDFSGIVVAVPVPDTWTRCLRWSLVQDEPKGAFKLTSALFVGDKADLKLDVPE